jgi:hypothetical protein
MTFPSPPAPIEPMRIGPVLVADAAIPMRAGAMAFMSQNTRDGEWLLPRFFRAVAVMGALELDLTRVRLGPGVSEIEAIAWMGEVNIRVPHNLRVACDGAVIMGGVYVKWKADSAALPDAPLIRITGSGGLGAVNVKIVDPNARGWMERWRGA